MGLLEDSVVIKQPHTEELSRNTLYDFVSMGCVDIFPSFSTLVNIIYIYCFVAHLSHVYIFTGACTGNASFAFNSGKQARNRNVQEHEKWKKKMIPFVSLLITQH